MKLFCASILVAGLALTSCDAIYEDLDPCPRGADLKLTYTRNVVGADAFDQSVHCANVHIYDGEGHLVSSHSMNGATASLPLPPGRYHAVAYGGMDCEEASFAFNDLFSDPAHLYTGLTTSLLPATRDGEALVSSAQLHPHFHAAADFEISAEDMSYRPVVMDLTKNTNNVRVVLQHSDGSSVDPEKFSFAITADNSTMAHDNSLVAQGSDVTYRPWIQSSMVAGLMTDGTPVTCAFAEMATARFTPDLKAVLTVTRKSDNTAIIRLPLVNYFDMIKSYEMKDVSLADYLDCQDMWSLVFILDPKTESWAQLGFIINDWSVEYNDFDF